MQAEQSKAKSCKWFGDYACKPSCYFKGHDDGSCNENNDCICSTKLCKQGKNWKLGRNWGCKESCKVLRSESSGACDENNKCICSDGKGPFYYSIWR